MNGVASMRLVLLGSAMLLCSGSILAAERPNVVILLSDDLGWRDIDAQSVRGGLDPRDS